MSQPSADAKAVVRAAEALTKQVRRIADTLTTPVVRYEVAADDDGPTTPATTCSAQHHGTDRLVPTACIRAAHHEDPKHSDGSGFHWTEAVAVYPTDSTVKVSPPLPRPAEEIEDERAVREREATTLHLRCPYCADRQLIPRRQLVEHIARLHPDVETEGPADDEDAQRTARRASLRNLLDRLDRSTVHHYDEAQLLRQHVEAEIREADTAREVARGNRRHVQHLAREIDRLTAEVDQAQAAIERVRAAVKWARHNHPGLVHVHDRLRAALDGTEQPEPPARNFAAYQAAIARVALILREEREHREQTDPSERQDCVMCGADHFAEIRDAIKGKQPTTEGN